MAFTKRRLDFNKTMNLIGRVRRKPPFNSKPGSASPWLSPRRSHDGGHFMERFLLGRLALVVLLHMAVVLNQLRATTLRRPGPSSVAHVSCSNSVCVALFDKPSDVVSSSATRRRRRHLSFSPPGFRMQGAALAFQAAHGITRSPQLEEEDPRGLRVVPACG